MPIPQRDLPEDAARVLRDNLWQLYGEGRERAEPPPLWQHAVTEYNEAHQALDKHGAPTTTRVRRVRGPDGEQDVTIGLAQRIHTLVAAIRQSAAPSSGIAPPALPVDEVYDSGFGGDLFNFYTHSVRSDRLLFSRRVAIVKAMIAAMLETERRLASPPPAPSAGSRAEER